MPNGHEDYNGEPPAPPDRPPDPMVEVAKEALVTFFDHRSRETFYERQLQVLFESAGKVALTPLEDRRPGVELEYLTLEQGFYHWIISKALDELTDEGRIAYESQPLGLKPDESEEGTTILFLRHPRHRFWKRQATEILGLVRRYSPHTFGRALGRHGEGVAVRRRNGEGRVRYGGY